MLEVRKKYMHPIERSFSLSHRMTQALGRAIVCGDYGPDDSLPTEADLCERFGVSRTSVREAVKMLTAKGLISSRPRKGIRILPEEEWNIFDSDLLRWSLESSPSMPVLNEFMQVRIAIEPEAAGMAAALGSRDRIRRIGDALERISANIHDDNAALEADVDFHISILYASENRYFIRLRDFIRTALNVSFKLANPIQETPERLLKTHSNVFHAIESGNVEQAKITMRMLVQEARNFMNQQSD